MDRLEEIFSLQKQLDEFIIEKRKLDEKADFTPQEWIQKKSIALMDETIELLNEVNYKWWKNPKKDNQGAIKEELIDILHFWVSMCHDAQLDANEVFDIYKRKNKENFDRQNGVSSKVGYDIDKQ